MTDSEFDAFMRSLPREKSQAEVDHIEHEHDAEQGEWMANGAVHHTYGESRG